MQYKFFEGTNVIEVHYLAAPSDGGSHTAGIENETGTVGVEYYYGTEPLTAPLAVQYTPTVTIEASAEDTATVTVEDPDIDVTPTSLLCSIMADQQQTLPMNVGNVGDADLTWTIDEATPPSLEASTGDFERGKHALSMERAPQGLNPNRLVGQGIEPLRLPGELAYGLMTDLNIFENQVGSFDTDVPGTVNVINSTVGFYPASDFINGDWTTLYALDYDTNQFVAVDTATGTVTPIGTATPTGNWSGAAGDTDGTFYAASALCGSNSYLYTIDVLTGAPSLVGEITNSPCVIGIAINSAGEMYGFDVVTDELLAIDKATGAGTVVGSLGYDANFSQGCDFDETTDTLYISAYNNLSGTGELRIADTATGNTTLVGLFGGSGLIEVNTMAVAAGGACSNPSDVPWLSLTPTGGTTPPAGSQQVDVTCDSTGLAVGIYEAVLCVRSNDPDEPLVQVPTTLDVIIPVELMSIEIE
jgi:hypothetical protein